MPGTGTATVNFGSTPVAEASVTVTDAGVTSSAYVEAFVMIDSTGDNDTEAHQHAAASWKLACEPGSGTFTLYVTALMDLFWGTFKVRYVWV
jgi:hypothetical protein